MVHEPEKYKGGWGGYFGNGLPLHVEIGCGKGRFITQQALGCPGANFVALEREDQVVAASARLSKSLPVECRLAFVVGDAKNMGLFFAPGEVRRIYINFCDHWPNRRKWQKRRLTHPGFLEIYQGLFPQGGEVFLKTDNKELFGFSLCSFRGNGWRLRDITLDLHHSGMEGNVMTEYEEKFSQAGMPIYRCEAIWGGKELST